MLLLYNELFLTEKGAVTVAAMIGFENSYILYISLITGAYHFAMLISLFYHWGCLLTLLTIPIALSRIQTFGRRQLDCMPQMTSRLFLPYGISLFVGIMISETGLLALVSRSDV